MSLSKPSYSGAAKRSAMTADARPGLTGDSAKTSEGDETAGGLITADLCIIGAGSGGLSVAAAAAPLGQKVVLIEKHKMGGDCLNYGCVPSKALIAAGKRAQHMRSSAAVRHRAESTRIIDMRWCTTTCTASSPPSQPNDSVERFTGLGVRVIRAAARSSTSATVLAGDHRIKARRFVIATGSSPAVPPIPGLDGVPYFTNETIFDNAREARPSHHHRRRTDRPGAGAGAPAPRQPRHRARGPEGARQGRSRAVRGGAEAPARRRRRDPRRRAGRAHRAAGTACIDVHHLARTASAGHRRRARICLSPPGASPMSTGLNLEAAAHQL